MPDTEQTNTVPYEALSAAESAYVRATGGVSTNGMVEAVRAALPHLREQWEREQRDAMKEDIRRIGQEVEPSEGRSWWRHPETWRRMVTDRWGKPSLGDRFVSQSIHAGEGTLILRGPVDSGPARRILRPAKLYPGGPTGWLVETGECRTPTPDEWWFSETEYEPRPPRSRPFVTWHPILEPLPPSEFEAHGVENQDPVSDGTQFSSEDWSPDAAPVQALLEATSRTREANRFRAESVQAANRVKALEEMGWELRPRITEEESGESDTAPTAEEELVEWVKWAVDAHRDCLSPDQHARRIIERVREAQPEGDWERKYLREFERADKAEARVRDLEAELTHVSSEASRHEARAEELEDEVDRHQNQKVAAQQKQRVAEGDRRRVQEDWKKAEARVTELESKLVEANEATRQAIALTRESAEPVRYRCSKCRAPKGQQVLGQSCNNNCGGKVIDTLVGQSAEPVRVTEEMVERVRDALLAAIYEATTPKELRARLEAALNGGKDGE